MTASYYNGYGKLNDIFEKYLIYNFDEKLVNYLIEECGSFLHSKNISPNIIKHFTVEFEIKGDNSYVGLRGGNLMSTLWLIDVYPTNPEKFIKENTCVFQGKKYIYDPRDKTLKIKKYATEGH